MSLPDIKNCPGTLSAGFDTYSKSCINRMFGGHKVNHILPYDSPAANDITDELYLQNKRRMSISGVQEKFSVVMEKNKLRLINEGEQGTYILKPIPSVAKNADQMPANEHLTMQIARQIFRIETAENALIFFKDGSPAYITKRFDVNADGSKLAQDDFASLAGRTPQTHGEHYKYLGNYYEIFEILKQHLVTYKIEAPKLYKVLLFNYLFSNGDAHFKNFSLLETPMGDYRLSPAYDLLNSRIHIEDKDFALEDGLLPKKLSQGKIREQFYTLAKLAAITDLQVTTMFSLLNSQQDKVAELIQASYLNDHTKRNYLQAYHTRLKKIQKE
jgi:serine/threonine-protein kinase HipA